MRRARSTPGNHRSVSSHLQRPVSPLPSIRKRNLFIGPFEENPPNKKLRESVEVLADDTSEPLDNHSESNSEASAYEDCKSVGSEPDFGMDSDHSSDVFSPQSEAEFMLPENINDDTAWTDIERKLMARVQRLQAANDDLLLQVSLKNLAPHTLGTDLYAHIMNLQRQRDDYYKEYRKTRLNEDRLLHRMTELLSRITQLESEIEVSTRLK